MDGPLMGGAGGRVNDVGEIENRRRSGDAKKDEKL